MVKKIFITIVIAVAVAALVLILGSQKTEAPTPSEAPVAEQPAAIEKPAPTFAKPQKSAHYESNTPAHGAILAGAPVNVVIDFNFDLAPPSSISIQKDGQDYGIGETVIDSNRLAMRRTMNSGAPDGVYTVKYNACWPDGSCHQGHFQFTIDRSQTESFMDLRGKKEVAVALSNTAFNPRQIRVSKGTKIVWTNNDPVEHYVNTDSHPAHTYYLAQNSRGLKIGDSYSITFDRLGIYLYHCSAHTNENMIGSILVE